MGRVKENSLDSDKREKSPQQYDQSKLEQENGKFPEKEGMLPRKISKSDQFSYVLDSDGRRWQILLLL